MIVRHVSLRCPQMRRHMTYVDHRPLLPVPCDECYSVESYSRRIPYEPDSRTENVTYPKSDADGQSQRAITTAQEAPK